MYVISIHDAVAAGAHCPANGKSQNVPFPVFINPAGPSSSNVGKVWMGVNVMTNLPRVLVVVAAERQSGHILLQYHFEHLYSVVSHKASQDVGLVLVDLSEQTARVINSTVLSHRRYAAVCFTTSVLGHGEGLHLRHGVRPLSDRSDLCVAPAEGPELVLDHGTRR